MNLLTVFTTEGSALNLTYAEVLSSLIFFLPLVVAVDSSGLIIAVWLTITDFFLYAREAFYRRAPSFNCTLGSDSRQK